MSRRRALVSDQDRIEAARLRRQLLQEQIAHLKVLLEVAIEELPARTRDMQIATKNLMVAEAQIATFRWRITEATDEVAALKGK